MLNNKGLVNHCKMAYREKWGYVWGTFGQVLTSGLLKVKADQYPDDVGNQIPFIRTAWLNKRVADCVGLIKSYMWWDNGGIIYHPVTDVSANTMFARATKKGLIANMPNVPGICVWKRGHIGVYVGEGFVIESHGTRYGVVTSPLKGSAATPWTHWLECPYILYEEDVKTMDDNYIKIIEKVSEGYSKAWVNGVNAIDKAATADGNLGDIEIFKFLPELIVKIAEFYSKK